MKNEDLIVQGKPIRIFKASSENDAQKECRDARAEGGVYRYSEERPHMGPRVKFIVKVYREKTTQKK